MIYDAICSMNKYFRNNLTWKAVSTFVQDIDDASPAGRFEVCEGVFAMVSHYPTKELLGSEMEVHEKYTDVQFLLSGRELIGYQASTCDLTVTQPFNVSDDIGFFKSTDYSTVLLQKGVFALFPAGEFHMPQLQATSGVSESVVKVVVKIETNLLF